MYYVERREKDEAIPAMSLEIAWKVSESMSSRETLNAG